jgi:hypothetical protein
MVKLVSVAFILFAAATAARADPMPVPMPDRGGSYQHSRIQAASVLPSAGTEDAIPQRNGNCPARVDGERLILSQKRAAIATHTRRRDHGRSERNS